MREIIAASTLAPILNRDRGLIADTAMQNIQATMDAYDSGITIVRVNLDKADPPAEVIDASAKCRPPSRNATVCSVRPMPMPTACWPKRAVKRRRSSNRPKATAPRSSTRPWVRPAASPAVLAEYEKAEEVTRSRLYLETMERVLGQIDKIDPGQLHRRR